MSNKKQKVILKFKNDAFVEQLKSLLLKTGSVKVGGLGIFEIRKIPAREAYNVGSGKMFLLDEHNKLAFKPTKKIKDVIQDYDGDN